jgi:hypothetical protein
MKGFQQIQGVDYDETFSPIEMLKSIRILVPIAAYFDYEIWHMDVKRPPFLMATLRRNCTWYNRRVLSILRMLIKYASFKGPFID